MLNTILFGLQNSGLDRFNFAGFAFPKYVWTLPQGPLSKRLDHHKRVVCGAYYHSPKPNSPEGSVGFYLDSDGAPGLRWAWCDEVDGVRINHTGWFADEYGEGDTIRGIVLRLPAGRGFLAGWSMGTGMASGLERYIYSDEVDAAYAADELAKSVAEDNLVRAQEDR